jgi:hypothetical protein
MGEKDEMFAVEAKIFWGVDYVTSLIIAIDSHWLVIGSRLRPRLL